MKERSGSHSKALLSGCAGLLLILVVLLAATVCVLLALTKFKVLDDRSYLLGRSTTCLVQAVDPNYDMRILSYLPGTFQHQIYVISLANGRGSWVPVAEFSGAFEPRVTTGPDGTIQFQIAAREARVLTRWRHAMPRPKFQVAIVKTDGDSDRYLARGFKFLRCQDDSRRLTSAAWRNAVEGQEKAEKDFFATFVWSQDRLTNSVRHGNGTEEDARITCRDNQLSLIGSTPDGPKAGKRTQVRLVGGSRSVLTSATTFGPEDQLKFEVRLRAGIDDIIETLMSEKTIRVSQGLVSREISGRGAPPFLDPLVKACLGG